MLSISGLSDFNQLILIIDFNQEEDFIIICCPQGYKFKELNIVSAEACRNMSSIAPHETKIFQELCYLYSSAGHA